MMEFCCRCCDFCGFCEPEEVCIDCVIEELNSKAASQGLAFSFVEEKFKDGEIPH